jgi:hypothetical protein
VILKTHPLPQGPRIVVVTKPDVQKSGHPLHFGAAHAPS